MFSNKYIYFDPVSLQKNIWVLTQNVFSLLSEFVIIIGAKAQIFLFFDSGINAGVITINSSKNSIGKED